MPGEGVKPPTPIRSSWILNLISVLGIFVTLAVLRSLSVHHVDNVSLRDSNRPGPTYFDQSSLHTLNENKVDVAYKQGEAEADKARESVKAVPPKFDRRQEQQELEDAAKLNSQAPIMSVPTSTTIGTPPKQVVVKKEETAIAAPAIKSTSEQREELSPLPKHERGVYSGLYRPDFRDSNEQYAGAWFAPKRRVLESTKDIKAVINLEGATMSVGGRGIKYEGRIGLMTRDFFDFQVLHLSSTTNQLPSNDKRLLDALLTQMQATVQALRQRALDSLKYPAHEQPDERLKKHTVALIPYCSKSVSSNSFERFQFDIRRLFFEATFWSVHRYIPHIIVTFPSQMDFLALESMKLPIWKTVDMQALFNVSALDHEPKSTKLLPKQSLLFLIEKLENTNLSEFSEFNYVYYTEADLVLQLRSEWGILDTLDTPDGGSYVVTPHRMQTIALPKAYPNLLDVWSRSGNPHRIYPKRYAMSL